MTPPAPCAPPPTTSSATTYTLYDGNTTAGRSSRLLITATPGNDRDGSAAWLVQFTCWGKSGRTLDLCAIWRPCHNDWDPSCRNPRYSRLLYRDKLAIAEAWLRGRPVGEIGDTPPAMP
jgi:hypothetical protein